MSNHYMYEDDVLPMLEPDTKGYCYISGPISKRRDAGESIDDIMEDFVHAELSVRSLVYTPINPLRYVSYPTWNECLSRDLRLVTHCRAAYMLRDWQSSRGARLERFVAGQLGHEMFYGDGAGPYTVDELKQLPKESMKVGAEADSLVYSDRERYYGHPYINLQRIAAYFTAELWDILKPGQYITWRHAWRMLVGLKLARDKNAPKRDNKVDSAGYAIVGERAEEYEREHGNDDSWDEFIRGGLRL